MTIEQALSESTQRAVAEAVAPLVAALESLCAEVASLRADPDQELGERQAAELVALAPATLRKFRRVGGGPAFRKVGKRVTYRRGDVLAWSKLEERRVNNQPAGPARRAA